MCYTVATVHFNIMYQELELIILINNGSVNGRNRYDKIGRTASYS